MHDILNILRYMYNLSKYPDIITPQQAHIVLFYAQSPQEQPLPWNHLFLEAHIMLCAQLHNNSSFSFEQEQLLLILFVFINNQCSSKYMEYFKLGF